MQNLTALAHITFLFPFQSTFFGREDQALSGFSEFFKKRSGEERDHAMALMQYQSMRGGRVVFQEVAKPPQTEWSSALEAVETALELEKAINSALLELHKVADARGDPQFCDFLEGNYLKEQVEDIKELADLVTRLRRAGEGLGVHLIDKELI